MIYDLHPMMTDPELAHLPFVVYVEQDTDSLGWYVDTIEVDGLAPVDRTLAMYTRHKIEAQRWW